MSLPRYAEYKDSGVAWLEQIPAHWSARRLKRIFEIKKRIAGEDGHEILSITQRGIKVKDIESNDGQLSMDYSKYQFVELGDFAMNHMDLLTGYVDISPYFGVTSPDYRVFSIRGELDCDSRYFLYLLQNGYKQRIFYAFGQGASEFGRWRFPTNQFNDFVFPYPSSNEQTAIASFLDRETEKIDALIAEQEKLIALLAEKRQATISHAVTRGLNPDASLKDSGVAWLGSVPAHWDITRLKYVTRLIADCPHETPVYDEKGTYKVVRTADVTEGQLHADNMYCVNEVEYEKRIRRHALRKDDLVYGREGERWGFAAQVPEDEKFCLGQRMMQFRSTNAMHSRYLMWQLNSLSTYRQGQMDTVGAAAPHVNVGTIRNYCLAEPPLGEQEEIFAFLDSESIKLDVLTTEAKRVIALLTERRSALIAAAVTGQIDVRGAGARPVAKTEAMVA